EYMSSCTSHAQCHVIQLLALDRTDHRAHCPVDYSFLATVHHAVRRRLFLPSTIAVALSVFFFSSRRRHTRSTRDWSSDVCSSDLTSLPSAPVPRDWSLPAAFPRIWLPTSRETPCVWARY